MDKSVQPSLALSVASSEKNLSLPSGVIAMSNDREVLCSVSQRDSG